MKKPEPQFIAELDDKGQILWVWRKPPGAQKCHHLTDFVGAKRELKTATCHGATCEAIVAWVEERAQQV